MPYNTPRLNTRMLAHSIAAAAPPTTTTMTATPLVVELWLQDWLDDRHQPDSIFVGAGLGTDLIPIVNAWLDRDGCYPGLAARGQVIVTSEHPAQHPWAAGKVNGFHNAGQVLYDRETGKAETQIDLLWWCYQAGHPILPGTQPKHPPDHQCGTCGAVTLGHPDNHRANCPEWGTLP